MQPRRRRPRKKAWKRLEAGKEVDPKPESKLADTMNAEMTALVAELDAADVDAEQGWSSDEDEKLLVRVDAVSLTLSLARILMLIL